MCLETLELCVIMLVYPKESRQRKLEHTDPKKPRRNPYQVTNTFEDRKLKQTVSKNTPVK